MLIKEIICSLFVSCLLVGCAADQGAPDLDSFHNQQPRNIDEIQKVQAATTF